MAQTGYTPILIYSSSTASQAPAAGNLTNSTLGSELAINITDGKLFYKDNANNVQVIAWKTTPTTAGGTGLTSYSQGDLLYYNTGTTLTALAKNTTATRYLSNTGSNNNPAWAQVDLSNGVTGTLPVANGGTGQTSYTNGELLIGNTSGNTLTKATLTAGAGVTVTNGNGSITIASSGALTASAPVTVNADYTVAAGVSYVINNKSGSSLTVTLPAPASFSGRILTIQNYQAQTVVSASSNVVPQGGGSAGTAILLAVVGNWATLVSDGTNWVIMSAAAYNNLLTE
jgi:hypothetical protein